MSEPPKQPRYPNWELLGIAANELEANLIKGRLESAGIAVRVSLESVATLYGLTQGDLARARIFVPAEQLAEAREIVNAEIPPDALE